MSRKSIILAVPALMVIFFVTGWLSYEWVLHFVTAKIEQRIIFTSVQEPFNHRLMMSLSFALVGASIGFGVLLSGRFFTRYRYGRSFLILLLVAVLSGICWSVVLAKKVAVFGGDFTSAKMPILPNTSLLLSQIHLYEIGIFGSGCVLVMAIILAIFFFIRSREALKHL